jgi:hypothetical protein
MTGGTMCVALALAEPQVVERRMGAVAGMVAAGVGAGGNCTTDCTKSNFINLQL